jgi:hypothetical protein
VVSASPRARNRPYRSTREPTETTPPKTTEELYGIIMAKKKGVLGRWGVTAKILIDAISTRQFHLLKSEKPEPEESKEAASP